MDSFPAFIPLSGARVVIVGEGEAAEAKARLFERSPAEVVRLDAIAALEAGALTGARLVFVAADRETAARVAEAARAAGALVNAVDLPALSDFITPAVVDRGPIVAGIGTGGAAPVLATLLRGEIEARWPDGLGRLGELSKRLQPAVREALPDLAARRAFWRRLIASPAAEAAMAGDGERGEALARAVLAERAPPQGRVWFLSAPAEPERLTLAAVRALGAADHIVAGEDVAPAILTYARRDAARSTTATAEEMAGWARSGLSVVRMASALDEQELEAVRVAGAEIQRLPSAR